MNKDGLSTTISQHHIGYFMTLDGSSIRQRHGVKFTGWAATNVREQQRHHSQKITKTTKDYVIARFELSDLTEFKRWILGFGRHAVVLSPKKLVKEIAIELTEARAGYGPEVT